MYNTGKTSKKLYAIINSKDEIVYTRGGSSTAPRLMVYPSRKAAEKVLRNHWTRQVHKEDEVKIVKIYPPESE